MKSYKAKKSVAILMYILAPLMIIIFSAGIGIFLFTGEAQSPVVYWLLLPVFVALIALMVVGLLDTIRGRFVIDDDRIYTVSAFFGTRTLAFSEIKGYRIIDKFVFIEPLDASRKRIRIGDTFEGHHEIKAWLAERYPDLNVVNFNEEKEAILSDQEFGSTEAHRVQNLKRAGTVAKGINIIGGIVAGWAFFIPEPYMYATLAAIIMPIVALVVAFNFRGLIRVNQKPKSAYPSVFVAVFFPAMAICLRAMLDINIFDYTSIWIPAAVIGLVYTLVAARATKEFNFKVRGDIAGAVIISIFMFGYGYGTVVVLNCLCDKSEPQVYQADVLKKRISSGKTTSYYLELAPWGQRQEADEVSVADDIYDLVEVNDSVNIYFMQGYFGIPWFQVTP